MNKRAGVIKSWGGKRVLVTGGAGFLGSYVVENLVRRRGLQPEDIIVPRSKDCDLRVFENCRRAVLGCDVVIHLAAVTGGIGFSRQFPASQYHDSTKIDLNVLEAARLQEVDKLVAIGNVFAYDSQASMPLEEVDLFNGLPTDAHRGVGWLKRNLALLADLYHRQYGFPMVVVYSANGYGPRDRADPKHSHVIPATIGKCMHDSELLVWGDGSPTRDFLYAEDIAEGLVLAAERLLPPNYVNIGSGNEISIRELVELIAHHTGFEGRIVYDATKGGGDARRCVSIDKARELMGFRPSMTMDEGLRRTIEWYQSEGF